MIQVEHLSKSFQVAKRQSGFLNATKALFHRETTTLHALKDISFTINDGEMVGYIGPNGAGKSTTIKTLCGVLTPDSGRCVINGRTPWLERTAHTQEIGVVFGQRSQLWWDVPVADSFELIRDIYSVPNPQYQKNLAELTELLQLGELLKTPARTLSLGQRMRCELAASLLHDPKILFLDEPTIGLDAVSKIAVRKFIQKLNAEKKTTVILTTHDMQDIEALAQRIILIGRGEILLDGNLPSLKQHFAASKMLTVEYAGKLPTLPCGLTLKEQTNGRAVCQLNPHELSVADAVAFFSQEVTILDLAITSITAEEMVAKLYQEYQI
ncbi:ABC transporter ATP-binding protein [Enterococcus nangangensis]|uniref:ABC transporter ATP-binding protein n=1 Tax=Enterococcus nangangensis TaxID=2559926 RepID=UPI0010F4B5C6|nr:ABC transporter ATP-binding protein [Enterococcus nangangensis]